MVLVPSLGCCWLLFGFMLFVVGLLIVAICSVCTVG